MDVLFHCNCCFHPINQWFFFLLLHSSVEVSMLNMCQYRSYTLNQLCNQYHYDTYGLLRTTIREGRRGAKGRERERERRGARVRPMHRVSAQMFSPQPPSPCIIHCCIMTWCDSCLLSCNRYSMHACHSSCL